MYAASTTSTTTSASRHAGGSASMGERRIRVVRLLRPRRSAPAFGFSLRGGREYATGFFISKVEFNSEAHHQGLKIGDQLVSVNGYRVDDAVHAELAHYITSQSRLKMKVRNVGMIPVKDFFGGKHGYAADPRLTDSHQCQTGNRRVTLTMFAFCTNTVKLVKRNLTIKSKHHEGISWQFVSDRAPSLSSGASSSPTLCHDTDRLVDLRLSILVPPRAKLGCGICKGPEWKPGIFVQFVREGGIAREAGLRPGDQIMSCNGQDFTNISFNDAISAMKAFGRLELVIREGAGVELVSPESSGYNSSASSAAGERSPAPPAPLAPAAALRRRLASVAEEAADRADRLNLNRLKRRTWDSIDFDWKTPEDIHNFDAPSDIEPDYDSPSIPNNPHTYEKKIFNNPTYESQKKNTDKPISYESQKKNLNNKKDFITSPSNRTIINLTEDGATIQCSYDNQMPRKTSFSNLANKDNEKKTIVVEVHHLNTTQCTNTHCKPPPMNKKEMNSDSASLSSNATLSSAIADEIQRRKLLKKTSNQENSNTPPEPPKKPNVPKPIENEKKKQHDALMDEFKKVHRKMFANQESVAKKDDLPDDADSLDRQQTLPLRKVEVASSEVVSNGHQPKREATDNPPPPPPMPATNGLHSGDLKKTISQIQEKINTDLTNGSAQRNGVNLRNGTLTRTPTPDYNKTEPLSQVKLKSINGRDEKADMESLESYKLKNPSSVQPKPPSNYFMRAPNGTATMKKNIRPVSVTIGEYGSSDGVRKQPSKLEFLNGDKPDGPETADDASITNRLQSELALTLSRSNLRKKTDALKKILSIDSEESDVSLDKNFHARYGNNLLPLPPSIHIPKVSGVKHD